MWIGNATDTKGNQSIINVAKRVLSPQESMGEKQQASVSTDGDNAVIRGVDLNISDAGKQKLKEQENFLSYLQDQLDSIKEQEKAGEESWATLGKCLKIAARIAAGDNVPQQDMHYLQEHNPELFMKAMLLRMPKEDPEDCESVLEDEEDNEDSGESSARVVESGTTVDMGGGESSGSAGVSVE